MASEFIHTFCLKGHGHHSFSSKDMVVPVIDIIYVLRDPDDLRWQHGPGIQVFLGVKRPL